MWTAPNMTAHDKASVLRRKTRAAREGSDPRVMSPVKALRLSLARAADTLFGLALIVATVEQRRIETGELDDALGSEGLFMLLDGARGARGALRLDIALMTGLIEVQTIGQVLPGALRERPATRTDAAMVAPLVDALLAGFDTEMAAGHAHHAPRGFRFGDRVEDARALGLLLPASEFDFFRLTIDLGPGKRTGRLDLLLPPAPAPIPPRSGAVMPQRRADTTRDIASVALSAPVVLDAVIARISLPLREAMTLRPGDHLGLPRDCLARSELVAAGGLVAAEGRLGQREGWRALRLAGHVAEADEGSAGPEPPSPEKTRPLFETSD